MRALRDISAIHAIMPVAILMATVSCGTSANTVTVTNHLSKARHGEMVEIPLSSVDPRISASPFTVTDSRGTEIPYQITHDSLLIFSADVDALSSSRYTIARGVPAQATPKVYGRKFPEHKDNMNWENDRCAYVAYGPALQNAGERGFGYDIWTKSVDTLVIEQRNRDRDRGISIHRDHGNGMDAYTVANTLGAGTAALIDNDGAIVFPWAWKEYEILDNGPLRFTVRLTYNPLTLESNDSIIETRIITLDAGSDLNRTTVSYSNLHRDVTVAPGIVVHTQNPYAYMSDPARGIIAYTDSTDNTTRGNGAIYIGAIVPGRLTDTEFKPVDEPARDALGHILARTVIAPGDTLRYYWGASWSKSPTAPDSPSAWLRRLRDMASAIDSPLSIEIR